MTMVPQWLKFKILQATPPPTQFHSLPQDELPNSPVVGIPPGEMAAFVVTLSPEEQEAFEVELAQQQEALLLRFHSQKLSVMTIRKPVGLTFLNLPPEILRHILFHLPFTSIAICQWVNRHLHVLISQSTDLQYYVHLGISGLVDNPCNDLAVSERLSLLLVREHHWDKLNFNFHKVVDLTFLIKSATAGLSAGVFGGTVSEKSHYMRIPSAATEEVKWREVHVEQKIVSHLPGFHEPDLHILITAQPQTVYTDTAKPSTDSRERNRPEDQVLIYEWKTGELKLDLVMHQSLSTPIRRMLLLLSFISTDEPLEPVLYDEWGPPVCQWFNGNEVESMETVFGQKYIIPPLPARTEGVPLTLLDFNPIDVVKVLAAENHLQATASDEGDCAQVEEDYCAEGALLGYYESEYKGRGKQVALQLHEASGLRPNSLSDTIETYDLSDKPRPQPKAVTLTMDPLDDPEGCFEHTVYLSLLYTVHSSQGKYSFDALLLDEENILGIQVCDHFLTQAC
ncbi:hypothetical protein P691DRAFT_850183 [Macrolepiota fuliginosa MF-IS2]|uniref:F-box domain-containing protein n=1 Tax=Macrolepiota fuliginosa MF-IS2 TaxID=1400762 RepID=A0A9P5WZC3_9AGAR|nr:hypothetical protein P691DRAFT_850183 [Macrolepiota fuliginosa MF-IS2]